MVMGEIIGIIFFLVIFGCLAAIALAGTAYIVLSMYKAIREEFFQ
jgi:hypothetical protein